MVSPRFVPKRTRITPVVVCKGQWLTYLEVFQWAFKLRQLDIVRAIPMSYIAAHVTEYYGYPVLSF